MTQIKTPQERDAAAQALGYNQRKPAQWTNIPPAITGRQVAGTSGATGLGVLGFGKYEMPDGSRQVSWGLAQPALDAYRSMRYGLGFEQDPAAPLGYVSEDAISRGAFGAAGAMATGGISATTARAAGRPMAPQSSAGMFGFGRSRRSNVMPDTAAQIDDFYGAGARGATSKEINGNFIEKSYYDDHGMIEAFDAPDNMRIFSTELDPDLQGQGKGLAMYRDFIDTAHKNNKHVTSDKHVSNKAAAVYEKLKKLGYDVRKNPEASSDGSHTVAPNGHVFRVAKPGTPGTEFFSSGIPGFHVGEEDY